MPIEDKGLTQTGVHELMRMMIEQNAQRDKSLEKVLERLGTGIQFNMVPDLKQNIGRFNGESSDCAVAEEWLKAINTIAHLHNWPDEYKLEAVRSNLEGAAKNWFISRQTEIDKWSTFETLFKSMFMSELSMTEKWRRMDSRVQEKGESVHVYFHDKLRLCRSLGLSALETKKMLCVGLLSKELCNILLSNSHVQEVDLIRDIREFEEVFKERNNRFHRTTPLNNITVRQPKDLSPQKLEGRIGGATTRSKNVRCYNCSNYGHIGRDCPNPRKPMVCTNCGKEGHTKKYCQGKTEQPTVSFIQTQPNRSKYVKSVSINNHSKLATGLIDTGCDVCIIKLSVANRHQLEIQPTDRKLMVYGNIKADLVYGLTKATLKIDQVSEEVDLYVVNDDVQEYDLLIGQTFTEKDTVTFVKTSEEVIFDYNIIFPFMNEKHSMDSPEEVGTYIGRINYVQSVQQSLEKESSVVIDEGMIQCGPTITFADKSKLVELIKNYRECFALCMEELGCTDMIAMDIEDDNQPVISKPYKTSEIERGKIDAIVKEWKRLGIVTETDSCYASPVLLVSKKDGEPRLVVDYRKLNQQTKKKTFPITDIDDQLQGLSEAKIFCVLDLASGYLQVPLTEGAKHKTAFVTPTETGQFERMMFGLTNAPYVFSKLMAKVLGPLRQEVAVWYLDDVLIPAKDIQDMLCKLETVFKALMNAKLTLKLSKCRFACDKVEYLGFTISSDGLSPGSGKMKAISDFPAPKNKHDTRRFLGLTGYFRKFVIDYARKAKPVSDLLKKDKLFVWGPDQQTAFEKLKMNLTQEPILKLYNSKDRTELHCDASAVGLSGLLLQEGSDGKMHLTYAVSKKTTEAESMYHSTKLELMAVIWSTNRLRHLLIGIHFTIVTDCQAITHLVTKKTSNPQIARWATMLSEFDYEIKYRPGEKMAHVDATSRAPVDEPSDTMEELIENCLEVLSIRKEEDEVAAMQNSDPRLADLISILKLSPDKRTKEQEKRVQNFNLQNNLLYRVITDGEKIKYLWEVPNCMKKSLVVKYHDLAGHFAVDGTVKKIQEKYYFPRMRRYVKYHITCCPECLLFKIPRGKRPGELHPITPGKRPFEVINVDHIGPFVKSKKGNCHVLVIIDNLTKFVRLFSVKNTSTKAFLKCLKLFVLEYGLPKRLISDRGSCFTSREMSDYCTTTGIQHSLISVRHPQSNGQVERINAVLVPVIQVNMEEERNWDQKIELVQCQLNNSHNRTIGDTPFHVLYGYYANIEGGALVSITEKNEEWQITGNIQAEVRERIKKEHELWKLRYNTGHNITIKYNIGDIVYLKRAPEQTGESTKLQKKFRGPLVIMKSYPNDSYQVTALSNRGNHHYTTVAHVSNLKAYHLPKEEDTSQEEDTNMEEDTSQEEDTNKEEETSQDGDTINSDEETSIQQTEIRRSNRKKQTPKYLRDYNL